MPDINAAPPPSAVVAAAPATESSKANGSASGNGDAEAAAPFATVLQGQVKQSQEGKAAKSEMRKDDAAPPSATVPADALAILAPMLAGLVPAQSEAEPALDEDALALAGPVDGSASGPVAIAAPMLAGPALAAVQTPPAAAESAVRQWAPEAQAQGDAFQSDAAMPAGRDGQPTANTAQPSAILAGASAAMTESAAETGKSGPQTDNFASLLEAAQGTQIMAAHGNGPHRAAAPAETAAGTAVTTPVGTQGWDAEVGEKLSWMVSRQETRAELVLNPPHMGRIEVSLSLNGDQANAVFVSASPAVREALENAVPRLREILQDAGISLGQAQVGAESFQQQAGARENGDNPARSGTGRGGQGAHDTAFLTVGGSQTQWLRQGNGLIDTFA